MTRTVLILTYDFPPRGTTSVLRVAKFVRYLPRYGWRPVVVTAAVRGGHRDASLLEQLPPELEVIRVPNAFAPPEGAASPHSARPSPRAKLRSALRRLFVPDAQVLWTLPALEAASARIARGDVTVVFSTAPPFSVHLAALLLKRRHPRLPWVMDLRDIWSENPAVDTVVKYRLQRAMELRCLSAADHVVTATDGQRRLLHRSFPALPPKISTITNGFDPDDLPAAGPQPASEPLRLTHVGSIVGNRARAVHGLFAALSRLVEHGLGRQLELRLVGTHDPLIYAMAAPLEATGIVRLVPQVPYREAWDEMRSAGALLLLTSDDREGCLSHPNKLFEYWAAGRPVLALTPVDGDVARLIRESGSGSAVAPGDVDAITAALEELVAAAGREAVPALHTGSLARWERSELTRQLAGILDRVSSASAVEPAHA